METVLYGGEMLSMRLDEKRKVNVLFAEVLQKYYCSDTWVWMDRVRNKEVCGVV